MAINRKEKAMFYCKNCGTGFSTIQALTSRPCRRHPAGPNQGRHELYEGDEKSSYTCKYCGQNFHSILVMTERVCQRHPNGPGKGRHSPAL